LATDLTALILKVLNGDISVTGHPIRHFMFGSTVGFSGVGGSNGAISAGLIKSKMAAARHVVKFRKNIFLE